MLKQLMNERKRKKLLLDRENLYQRRFEIYGLAEELKQELDYVNLEIGRVDNELISLDE